MFGELVCNSSKLTKQPKPQPDPANGTELKMESSGYQTQNVEELVSPELKTGNYQINFNGVILPVFVDKIWYGPGKYRRFYFGRNRSIPCLKLSLFFGSHVNLNGLLYKITDEEKKSNCPGYQQHQKYGSFLLKLVDELALAAKVDSVMAIDESTIFLAGSQDPYSLTDFLMNTRGYSYYMNKGYIYCLVETDGDIFDEVKKTEKLLRARDELFTENGMTKLETKVQLKLQETEQKMIKIKTSVEQKRNQLKTLLQKTSEPKKLKQPVSINQKLLKAKNKKLAKLNKYTQTLTTILRLINQEKVGETAAEKEFKTPADLFRFLATGKHDKKNVEAYRSAYDTLNLFYRIHSDSLTMVKHFRDRASNKPIRTVLDQEKRTIKVELCNEGVWMEIYAREDTDLSSDTE